MKEARYFYVPEAAVSDRLPDDEANHALRVLRLNAGDEIILMDGKGCYHHAEVSVATGHHCRYRIKESVMQPLQWEGQVHVAIAPTKTMERMEWMAEKITEIGVNGISFLNCKFSERKVIKTPRIDRIVVSAMKQSHKAWKPAVDGMKTFKEFISKPRAGMKFIAHCYEEVPRTFLFDELCGSAAASSEDVTVMIGPEGDFSIDEVREAVKAGFISVHLGESRLRTETAAIAALMMVQLSKTKN